MQSHRRLTFLHSHRRRNGGPSFFTAFSPSVFQRTAATTAAMAYVSRCVLSGQCGPFAGISCQSAAVRARKDFSRAFLFAREQPDGPRHPYRRAFVVPEINQSRHLRPRRTPHVRSRVIARRFLSSRDFSPPLQHSPLQFIEFRGIGGRKGEGNGNVSNTPAIRYSGARSTVNGKFGGKEEREEERRGGLFLSIDRISGCQSCRVL